MTTIEIDKVSPSVPVQPPLPSALMQGLPSIPPLPSSAKVADFVQILTDTLTNIPAKALASVKEVLDPAAFMELLKKIAPWQVGMEAVSKMGAYAASALRTLTTMQ